MATRAGFYKSGKRNKELNRQKKQEAKRQRRLNKGEPSGKKSRNPPWKPPRKQRPPDRRNRDPSWKPRQATSEITDKSE